MNLWNWMGWIAVIFKGAGNLAEQVCPRQTRRRAAPSAPDCCQSESSHSTPSPEIRWSITKRSFLSCWHYLLVLFYFLGKTAFLIPYSFALSCSRLACKNPALKQGCLPLMSKSETKKTLIFSNVCRFSQSNEKHVIGKLEFVDNLIFKTVEVSVKLLNFYFFEFKI